ncbi:hypothetical protein [Paraburkholderia phenazinium]|uniref:Uncharacterized protein n=1 Tax=Paraburkholderia phenazinium TaxID=60549 RepID=A0A1N6KDD7_9BURK|nr:hypothetical protein [Paraburkholderia phenazinium]SIO54561.1 hypothetical protein SAMN05444168_6870 [Paraburkholderia phenazinium]
MALSVRQIKAPAAVAQLAVAMLLSASCACFGQASDTADTPDTAPASVDVAAPEVASPEVASPEVASPIAASEVTAEPGCSSVVLSCNTPSRPIAPEHQLLDPATARDQAQRAQAQADQIAAEQALQRRIEFARLHPNAIFVYGDKPTPQESVSDVFNRTLGVPTTTLTTSTFDATGRRTECVSACRGPLCCVTTP